MTEYITVTNACEDPSQKPTSLAFLTTGELVVERGTQRLSLASPSMITADHSWISFEDTGVSQRS